MKSHTGHRSQSINLNSRGKIQRRSYIFLSMKLIVQLRYSHSRRILVQFSISVPQENVTKPKIFSEYRNKILE